MGIGFKLAPGVRVRVSSRGVRTSVGPRAARVHVGAGRTTFSTGAGPVSVWTGSGRRTTRPAASRGPTAAQVQRQAAAAARAQQTAEKAALIQELIKSQQAMVTAHLQVPAPVQRPVVDVPEWVRAEQYYPAFEQQYLAGVGRFDRAGRQRARAAAQARAEQAAAAYNADLDARHRAQQADADRWWMAYCANDPDLVLETVNAAFADNPAAASAVALDGPALSVLMIQPAADSFGDLKAALTPTGRPTIARMSKTEQRQLWTECTLSRAVATIAEAFAVAPGVMQVHLAVVSRPEGGGDYRLVVLGDVRRDRFAATRWPNRLLTGLLADVGDFRFRIDRYGALTAIPTDSDAGLGTLMHSLNGAIEDDPELAGQASLRLPPTHPSPRETPPNPSSGTRIPASFERPHLDSTNSEWQAPSHRDLHGRAFELWGAKSTWPNMEISGTQYRQDAILRRLSGLQRGDPELDSIAQLVPEPDNPYDPNAVGCYLDGELIGYLPREQAGRYSPVLAKLVASGQIPTTAVRLRAHEFTDYDGSIRSGRRYYTSAYVALDEPEMIVPVTLPPPRPRVELPLGPTMKVAGAQDQAEALRSLLGDRQAGWAHATLIPDTAATARATKTVLDIHVAGRRIGALSPQMSSTYQPLVAPLHNAGVNVTVRVLIQASAVSAAVTSHARRPHTIDAAWFRQVSDQTGVTFPGA